MHQKHPTTLTFDQNSLHSVTFPSLRLIKASSPDAIEIKANFPPAKFPTWGETLANPIPGLVWTYVGYAEADPSFREAISHFPRVVNKCCARRLIALQVTGPTFRCGTYVVCRGASLRMALRGEAESGMEVGVSLGREGDGRKARALCEEGFWGSFDRPSM